MYLLNKFSLNGNASYLLSMIESFSFKCTEGESMLDSKLISELFEARMKYSLISTKW